MIDPTTALAFSITASRCSMEPAFHAAIGARHEAMFLAARIVESGLPDVTVDFENAEISPDLLSKPPAQAPVLTTSTIITIAAGSSAHRHREHR